MSGHTFIVTRSRDYGEAESLKAKGAPDSTEPLHITRPTVDPIPWMPKGSSKRSMIYPNAKVVYNYSIFEDLAQIPCAMFALEVLQSCPSQWSAFLTVVGVVDPKNSLMSHLICQILKRGFLIIWISILCRLIENLISFERLLMRALPHV